MAFGQRFDRPSGSLSRNYEESMDILGKHGSRIGQDSEQSSEIGYQDQSQVVHRQMKRQKLGLLPKPEGLGKGDIEQTTFGQ